MNSWNRRSRRRQTLLAATILATAGAAPGFAQDAAATDDVYAYTADNGDVILLDPIVVQAASEQLKQSLGVSVISAEDLQNRPVVNDLKDSVRRMPGVNLTGASATGQRGNQRQIDIRGMGPENTLILIDGKPVLSRESIKMGRGGERDTRGDSNWVPAEMVESIEVIRGPAAARYGSGAAGGVVNIITKVPEEDSFTVNLQYNQPESSLEGNSYRGNFLWAKRLSDNLSFRLNGSYNRSNPDDPEINEETVEGEVCYARDGTTVVDCAYPAGVEGVENRDASVLLRWEPDDYNSFDFELGYSRQDNIYTGDSQLSNGSSDLTGQLANDAATTNKVQRTNVAVTHRGAYAFGDIESYVQYEHTDNSRLLEGPAGGSEGRINSTDWGTVLLDNVTAKSELNMPGSAFGREATWTLGGEIRYQRMDDPVSIENSVGIDFDFGDTVADPENRDPVSSQTLVGVYGEGNIQATDQLVLTPAVRLDWADTFGTTLSGSFSATYELTSDWTLKASTGRAFKAPNLYQLSPNYLYTSRGNGCPEWSSGQCYVLGNPNLKAETSWNTEIGVAYSGPQGIDATLTAFYNDYRDKIQSGDTLIGTVTVDGATRNIFQWENIPHAVVGGVEGSFNADLAENVRLFTNFTWMAISENKETGNPLSLVPKYTINASLEWQATDKLTIIPSLTHYGEIEAPSVSPTTGSTLENNPSRDPYTLVDLSGRYEIDDSFDVRFGVTNVFNRTILRSNDGANTYNEPGRAYYVGLSKTF